MSRAPMMSMVWARDFGGGDLGLDERGDKVRARIINGRIELNLG
jgi:hypothetical protein